MSEIMVKISTALSIIGAINWGLLGAFNLDLVAYLFGEKTTLTRIIYVLVGISGIINLLALVRFI